jgi:hypothetical protein
MSPVIDVYADLRTQLFAGAATMEFGDPQATTKAILQIVDMANPPLRFFVGTEGLPVARKAFADRLATWEAWEVLSNEAQGVSKKLNLAL